jgi:hypothetical protein
MPRSATDFAACKALQPLLKARRG